MSDSTIEIFIAAYGTEQGAKEALKDFKASERDGTIDLIDGAVIVHTAEGDLKQVGESLPPGTSALIAVAEDRMLYQLERSLADYDRISRHAVSAEGAALIVAEVGDAPEEEGTPEETSAA